MSSGSDVSELQSRLDLCQKAMYTNRGYTHLMWLLKLYRDFVDASAEKNIEKCSNVLEQVKGVVVQLQTVDRDYDFILENFKMVYNQQIDLNNVFIQYVRKCFIKDQRQLVC